MEVEKDDYFSDTKFVRELNPTNFDSVKTWCLKSDKCSIVLFYVPWCPYCKKVKNTWIKLGEIAAFFEVCAYNGERYKSHLGKIKEDMPELVKGFPTMIIYQRGEPVERVGIDETQRDISHLLKACMRVCGR